MNELHSNGDVKEVRAISSDISQILKRIYHHGKCEDPIVKGCSCTFESTGL